MISPFEAERRLGFFVSVIRYVTATRDSPVGFSTGGEVAKPRIA